MWHVDYYTRPNGRKPAKEWIDDQDNSIKPSIDVKIQALKAEGLLLPNRILKPIEERRKRRRGRSKIIPGFYELRDVSKKWRIAVYHDLRRDMFLLILGWRKTRQLEVREVERAIRLLDEYKRRDEE